MNSLSFLFLFLINLFSFSNIRKQAQLLLHISILLCKLELAFLFSQTVVK